MAEPDIEKLKSCTAINDIPILTLDERWYHLITDKLKTDEIRYWEKRLNERLIQEAKDKINSLEDEALDIPRDIVDANRNLLIETVKVCYNKINSNKEDLEVLDKWINATRVKLKKNILIKQDKEEANNRMYSSMHDILGADVMKELDRINEE